MLQKMMTKTNWRRGAQLVCIGGMGRYSADALDSVRGYRGTGMGVSYLRAVLAVALHLHALTQIHQTFVDLASFC